MCCHACILFLLLFGWGQGEAKLKQTMMAEGTGKNSLLKAMSITPFLFIFLGPKGTH